MGKMRFRRIKSAILPHTHVVREKRPRGRPKKEMGGAAHKLVRLNGKLMNTVLVYNRPGESHSDTILRIIHEQSQRIKDLEAQLQQANETKENNTN